MAIPKGRNCRIEIAATYGAAKVVTAITKAKPGVASSAAHGLANGSVGYFDAVIGMDELQDQAVSVSNQASGTFELQKLNTTNYGSFVSGNFIPVLTWLTLSKATGYDIPNAETDKLDATTLLDTIKQEDAGLLAAQSVTINGFSDAQGAALDLLLDAAVTSQKVIARITLSNGERRIWRGEPSVPGESMSVGQLATAGLSITAKGRICFLPATF